MEKELIGKTIRIAKITGIEGYDDRPYLHLEMSDGSRFLIEAHYGGWTGDSEDEYPRFVTVKRKEADE